MQLGFPFPSAPPVVDYDALCDAEERAVARCLEVRARGAAQAMQVRAIAADVGLPAREVQEIIKHLIEDHQVPIGTSMREPYGNFLIVTREEAQETYRLLRSRGLSVLKRAAASRRIQLRAVLAELQAELLEEER